MEEQKQTEQVHGECLCMGAGPQATAILKHLGDNPATEHFRKARIEFLKGLRQIIDSRIAKIEKRAAKHGTSVPVD